MKIKSSQVILDCHFENNFARGSTYLNEKEARNKLEETKKKFYEEKRNVVPFVKPSKIVFGWNYILAGEEKRFQQLQNFATVNNIELTILEKKLNYFQNKFSEIRVSPIL